jgi:putative MFS transporter
MSIPSQRTAWFAVIVAALGYFVDVFDIWLFANFRIKSLTDLGLTGDELTTKGALILNCQQAGLLIGGFVWGILGDKYGRMRAMFGSILLYSLANIANGFVDDVTTYAVLRFVAGFGLAGEIGTGVTLVSELMSKEKRGYGVTIVATVGVAGAIGAAYVGKVMEWRSAFILGGVMGLSLLLLRVFVHESGMFHATKERTDIKRGSLTMLFNSRNRMIRFIGCCMLGIPVWVVFGLYGVFAPEIATSLGIAGSVDVPSSLLWASIGITAGDLISGLLSQWLRSRKKPIAWFVGGGVVLLLILHSGAVRTPEEFYLLYGLLGFSVGFWICGLATAAEQFGTNIRATVTTTIPNLVRAVVIPLTGGFLVMKPLVGVAPAVFILALIGYALCLLGLFLLDETFGRDLNFVE